MVKKKILSMGNNTLVLKIAVHNNCIILYIKFCVKVNEQMKDSFSPFFTLSKAADCIVTEAVFSVNLIKIIFLKGMWVSVHSKCSLPNIVKLLKLWWHSSVHLSDNSIHMSNLYDIVSHLYVNSTGLVFC